jgi:hypothetical protein
MSEAESDWEEFSVWRGADIMAGSPPEQMYVTRVHKANTVEEVAEGLRFGCSPDVLESQGGAVAIATEWVAQVKAMRP